MSVITQIKNKCVFKNERIDEFFRLFSKQDALPALHFASKYKGHEDIVEILVADQQDINEENKNQQTALMLCSENNLLNSVKILSYSGASLNLIDSKGRTALMYACANAHDSISRFLLERGADFDISDNQGTTCLMHAVKSGNEELVNIILAIKPKIDQKDYLGNTALSYTIQGGYEEMMAHFMKAGADLNIQDNQGRTALMSSVANEQKAMAQMLIASGVDTNIKDENGITSLSLSVATGNEDLVETLIIAGANVNNTDKDGNSALFGVKNILEEDEYALVVETLNEILDTSVELFSDAYDSESEHVATILGDQEDLGEGSTRVEGSTQQTEEKITVVKGQESKDFSNEIQQIKRLPQRKIPKKNLKKIIALLNKASANGEIKNNKGQKAIDISMSNSSSTNNSAEAELVKVLAAYQCVPLPLDTIVENNKTESQGMPAGQARQENTEVQGNSQTALTSNLESNSVAESNSENETNEQPQQLSNDELLRYLQENKAPEEKPGFSIPKELLLKRNDKGQTMLMLASHLGATTIIKEILKSKPNLNLKDKKGYRAISYASRAGNEQIIILLHEAGAQLSPKDAQVQSPITLAVLAKQTKSVYALAKCGADLNQKTKGMSLLMLMASRGNFEMVQALVNCKADVYAKDFKGKSASAYASKNEHKEIFRYLKGREV